ncbi:DnaJ domain [Trypanosoma melophagium]|uniref:DnaJ domain n=1 Tax=Trypanosoma melophagium TaxID=715481 RepID=UPI00351A28C0|nr:DnaJ domain [Trypanosoma melophagium]
MMRRSCRILLEAQRGPFNPYRILGVSPNASKEEVKKAYHRLALRYHPDGGREGNKERFQAVNEAYEAVKDGKWQSPESDKRQTGDERHGWDPRMGMYAYEQPGSTTENYVDSRTQTLLRLCVLWTAAFVALRFFLLWVFPYARATPNVEWATENSGNGAPPQHAKGDGEGVNSNLYSVHVNQDNDFTPVDNGIPFSTGASPQVDPLQRS